MPPRADPLPKTGPHSVWAAPTSCTLGSSGDVVSPEPAGPSHQLPVQLRVSHICHQPGELRPELVLKAHIVLNDQARGQCPFQHLQMTGQLGSAQNPCSLLVLCFYLGVTLSSAKD